MFVALPAIVDPSSFSWKTVLGMGFGLLAAFLWAFESVFIKLGMDTKDAKFTNKEIVLTRSVFTTAST